MYKNSLAINNYMWWRNYINDAFLIIIDSFFFKNLSLHINSFLFMNVRDRDSQKTFSPSSLGIGSSGNVCCIKIIIFYHENVIVMMSNVHDIMRKYHFVDKFFWQFVVCLQWFVDMHTKNIKNWDATNIYDSTVFLTQINMTFVLWMFVLIFVI